MKNINFDTKKNIEAIFPTYLQEDIFPEPENIYDEAPIPNHNYLVFSVSIYDHFLTQDEDWYHPTYSWLPANIRENLNEERWNEYVIDECKFILFYNKLYSKDVYMLSSNNQLVKFDSIEEFESYSIQDIREVNSQTYIIPSLGVLITGNFEFTHIVHASKEYYKKDEFEKIVKDSGLYILK